MRTRPGKLGQPFTHWSLRKLAASLAGRDRPVAIGRERLRLPGHRQERGLIRPGRVPCRYRVCAHCAR
jgi:hypothetical protein